SAVFYLIATFPYLDPTSNSTTTPERGHCWLFTSKWFAAKWFAERSGIESRIFSSDVSRALWCCLKLRRNVGAGCGGSYVAPYCIRSPARGLWVRYQTRGYKLLALDSGSLI